MATITPTAGRAAGCALIILAAAASASSTRVAASAGAAGGALISPIWGAKSQAGVGQASVPPAHLFVFTVPNPGAFVDKGAIKLAGVSLDVDALAQLPTSSLVGFELTAAGSRLIAIDSNTAAATPIGPLLAGREIRGAVARSDGHLVVVDAASEEILLVDPATGAPAGPPRRLRLGCAPYDVSSGMDLAIRDDGTLLLSSLNQILAVDVATGAVVVEHVDTTPMPSGSLPFLAGLAFEPGTSLAAAYDVNAFDDLLTYDTEGAFARTIILADIIPSFNAGRGDLACFVDADPAPLPGLVLADLNGDGVVNGADLGLLLSAWGPCPQPPSLCCADLNGDGVVDGADLGLLLAVWSE